MDREGLSKIRRAELVARLTALDKGIAEQAVRAKFMREKGWDGKLADERLKLLKDSRRLYASALKHLQNQFGLVSLNARMDAANDITDCIDLDRLMANKPAEPIKLPTFDSDEWPHDDAACVPASGGFIRADDPISDWADQHPEKFAGYDIRGDRDVYLRGIHEYCVKAGLYR